MDKIFQEYFLDNPAFRLVAIPICINKIFQNQLQRNPFLRQEVPNLSKKLLEKHLQRNLHFRRLFCTYEQNISNIPVKKFFFPVYCTPGYICDCS